jgi:hypothetical protein
MSALAIEVARDFSDIRDKIADIKLPGWERPVLSSYDQYIGRRVSEQPDIKWGRNRDHGRDFLGFSGFSLFPKRRFLMVVLHSH